MIILLILTTLLLYICMKEMYGYLDMHFNSNTIMKIIYECGFMVFSLYTINYMIKNKIDYRFMMQMLVIALYLYTQIVLTITKISRKVYEYYVKINKRTTVYSGRILQLVLQFIKIGRAHV